MMSSTKLWLMCGVAAWAVSLNFAGIDLQAQDSAKKDSAATEETDDAKTKGRLPAYYKEVVDSQQRDKIYGLQADYAGKIAPLQEQIKKLIADRDAAIEKVLTADQQEKLKKIREEANSKRKSGLAPAKKEMDSKK